MAKGLKTIRDMTAKELESFLSGYDEGCLFQMAGKIPEFHDACAKAKGTKKQGFYAAKTFVMGNGINGEVIARARARLDELSNPDNTINQGDEK